MWLQAIDPLSPCTVLPGIRAIISQTDSPAPVWPRPSLLNHLLREEAARTGATFKEVLNGAIRQALSKRPSGRIHVEPIFQAPFPREFDGVSLNRLADQF